MCDIKWVIWKWLIRMHYGTLQGTISTYKGEWEQTNKNNSLFHYNFTLKLQICISRTEVKKYYASILSHFIHI